MMSARMQRPRYAVIGLALIATLGSTAACSSSKSSGDGVGSGTPLVGLFRLTAGQAHGKQITGTWFRMLQPRGNVKTGPYMVNANSPADGGKVTLLKPGTAGGLRT